MIDRRRWLVGLMLLLCSGYVAAHSPVLGLVARLSGYKMSRCYFICSADESWAVGTLLAITAIGLAVIGGWIASTRFRSDRSDQLLAFGLISFALATIPPAWIGAFGWFAGATPLRAPLGPLLCSVPSAALIAFAWRRGGGHRQAEASSPPWTRLGVLLLGVAIALLSMSALLSFSRPPTSYDALGYHGPLAVYLWRDGNLGAWLDRQLGEWPLAHPGTAEIWFGLLRLAAGEHAANLGQLPLALLGACSVYVFALRTGVGQSAAMLAVPAFLMAPIVVLQSGVQLNDLTAGALIMAAVGLVAFPAEQWSRGRLALVGLALGLAVTTKLSVLPAAVGVGGAILAAAGPKRWQAVTALGAGFFLAAAPWWSRNLVLFGNPIYPARIPFIGGGAPAEAFASKDHWFIPSPWAWLLYPIVDPHSDRSGYGAMFAVGALPGLLVTKWRVRSWPLVLFASTLVFTLPAWWFLTPRDPRFLLGPLGLSFAFVGHTLEYVPRTLRNFAAGILGVAAIFSALVTIDRALLPLARTPSARAAFYDQVWGVDSIAAALPESEGLLYNTGHAPLSYAGVYPLLGRAVDRTLIAVDGLIPPDSIIRTMRHHGLHYAYVPAIPGRHRQVEAMFGPGQFELVHISEVEDGFLRGVRRSLYHLREQ